MISREELKVILKKHNFSDKQIERILNKKIKTLLAQGKAEEIEKILGVLEKKEIQKETIENCGVKIDFGHESVEML